MRPTHATLPIVVLDTNVVLDWLVFRDPGVAALRSAIEIGDCQWVATAAMRCELAHILARSECARAPPDAPRIWAAWDRHCVELPAPIHGSPAPHPRCTDPDDQKFIDLAVGCGARWLVSRDRAVLTLARRMRGAGVRVCTPGDWSCHEKGATEAAPLKITGKR